MSNSWAACGSFRGFVRSGDVIVVLYVHYFILYLAINIQLSGNLVLLEINRNKSISPMKDEKIFLASQFLLPTATASASKQKYYNLAHRWSVFGHMARTWSIISISNASCSHNVIRLANILFLMSPRLFNIFLCLFDVPWKCAVNYYFTHEQIAWAS